SGYDRVLGLSSSLFKPTNGEELYRYLAVSKHFASIVLLRLVEFEQKSIYYVNHINLNA
ncbi:hypothetical protein U1Q18_030851, partial [Sarracenia purpurea var. burkii]